MTQLDLLNPINSTNVRINDFQALALDRAYKGIGKVLNALSLVTPELSGQAAIQLFSKVPKSPFKPRGLFKDAKTEFIQAEGYDIAVYRFGQNSQRKVLLSHGWTGQASDFYRFIQPLLNAGFEVITFDGPAHGQSSAEHSTVFEHAKAIKAVTSHYPGIEFAIGHSMGAAASTFAMIQSEDWSPKKVVLMGGPNHLQKVFDGYASRLGLNSVLQNQLRLRAERDGQKPMEQLSISNALNHQPELKTMLVHDRQDAVIPFDRVEEIQEQANVDRVKVTYGLGHSLILRDEEVIDDVIEFLQDKAV